MQDQEDWTKEIVWPKGTAGFYQSVKSNAPAILTSKMIALDPASGRTSWPGYAVYEYGTLITSGELTWKKPRDISTSLQMLYDNLTELYLEHKPEILAIEEIKGSMCHEYLKWAIGVSFAAIRAPSVYIIPINVWKAVAKLKPGYTKTNAQDAEIIGESLILLAKGKK